MSWLELLRPFELAAYLLLAAGSVVAAIWMFATSGRGEVERQRDYLRRLAVLSDIRSLLGTWRTGTLR